MADAQAHAAIVVADVLGDRAQPVVAGIAAADLDPHFAGRQFGFVVEHHDLTGFQLVEVRRFRHRAAGLVHESAGQQQQKLFQRRSRLPPPRPENFRRHGAML